MHPFSSASLLVASVLCAHGCSEIRVIDGDGGAEDGGGGDGPTASGGASCQAIEANLILLDSGAIDVFSAAEGPGCETWVAGQYAGDVALSSVPFAPHAATWDGFLARIDSEGRVQRFIQVRGKSESWSDRVAQIVVDEDGGVYFSGDVDDETWIDGERVRESGGNFVAALDADGDLRWVTPLAFAPADLTIQDGALVAHGDSSATLLRASLNLASGEATVTELGVGSLNVLDAATSPAGTAMLVRYFGDISVGGLPVLARDADKTSPSSDSLVVGVSPAGEVTWTRWFDEEGFEANLGRIAIDKNGTVSFFISFYGRITVDSMTLVAPSDSEMTLLVARLYDGGYTQQAETIGHASLIRPLWAAVEASGGAAWSAKLFGGEAHIGEESLVAADFPGVGFRAVIDDLGVDEAVETLGEVEAIDGTRADAPIIVRRLRDELGQDLGLRINRAKF